MEEKMKIFLMEDIRRRDCLKIVSVELNPPSRVAIPKIPDSYYNSRLLTTKISNYEKEIGFYYCRAGHSACS